MTEFRREEVITGDNIGIVNKRARIKKSSQLCVLGGVANSCSGFDKILRCSYNFRKI